jgi:hypothetical protein
VVFGIAVITVSGKIVVWLNDPRQPSHQYLCIGTWRAPVWFQHTQLSAQSAKFLQPRRDEPNYAEYSQGSEGSEKNASAVKTTETFLIKLPYSRYTGATNRYQVGCTDCIA